MQRSSQRSNFNRQFVARLDLADEFGTVQVLTYNEQIGNIAGKLRCCSLSLMDLTASFDGHVLEWRSKDTHQRSHARLSWSMAMRRFIPYFTVRFVTIDTKVIVRLPFFSSLVAPPRFVITHADSEFIEVSARRSRASDWFIAEADGVTVADRSMNARPAVLLACCRAYSLIMS